ncbi:MAG: hypothetical protein SFX72_06235 [Isosphaeraceae bacterium]|nr:hypothetical protein [Isosphaeraceae bacterium]
MQTKNPGLIGLLFGSPFALIGLIFLMRGRFGVALPFLMLGVVPALAGTAIGRKAGTAQDPETPAGGQEK